MSLTNGLKTKQVKGVIEVIVAVACDEIKTNGNFKLAGMLNLKLKEKAAFAAKKGIKHVNQTLICFCVTR